MKTTASVLILGMLAFFSGVARPNAAAQPGPSIADNLNLYLQCWECDYAYVRDEVTFVDFVRDKEQADVHCMVSADKTGGGGRAFTLVFVGRNRFEGQNDTLSWNAKQSDSDDVVRTGLVRMLKNGLFRYALHTPAGDSLSLLYSAPACVVKPSDPWNSWVFRLNLNTYLNGQQKQSTLNLWGSVTADRVTEELKIHVYIGASRNASSYELDDGSMETYVKRSRDIDAYAVKSITSHWSAGADARFNANTFNNTQALVRLAPAIEYDLFPYKEAARRQLRFAYLIGGAWVRYYEETIYDKMRDTLFSHSLTIAFEFKQTWGNVLTTVRGSTYLHDFSKNNVGIYQELSLNVFEGLSLNLWVSYTQIRDQLSLPKGSISDADVLLQRTQLATSYSYAGWVGLSYTFGSIYNTVVNPRLKNW